MTKEITYAEAGVDIDQGKEFVKRLQNMRAKAWPDAPPIGGFAGRCKIPTNRDEFDTSTDSTGTKIVLAALAEIYDGIGQDAVAMSAVDIYAAGSKPFHILDFFAVDHQETERDLAIMQSLINGCKLAECTLPGGELAVLPDFFKYPWMCELVTFAIGFPLPKPNYVSVEQGLTVWGWPSYGPACNGFSLLRKVFKLTDSPSRVRPRLHKHWDDLQSTLADALLAPTPIWIKDIEILRRKGVAFAGHAHITGGGLVENIPRILPANCKVIIDRRNWKRPPIFRLTQELGPVSADEMDRVFNQGIMMVSIAGSSGIRFPAWCKLIGLVEKRRDNEPQVEFIGQYNDG
ncbi:AIR synthase-related protein [Patescibacteria group bacterium]